MITTYLKYYLCKIFALMTKNICHMCAYTRVQETKEVFVEKQKSSRILLIISEVHAKLHIPAHIQAHLYLHRWLETLCLL